MADIKQIQKRCMLYAKTLQKGVTINKMDGTLEKEG